MLGPATTVMEKPLNALLLELNQGRWSSTTLSMRQEGILTKQRVLLMHKETGHALQGFPTGVTRE
jgi:hypothetical protein